jgi:hypothetical protein
VLTLNPPDIATVLGVELLEEEPIGSAHDLRAGLDRSAGFLEAVGMIDSMGWEAGTPRRPPASMPSTKKRPRTQARTRCGPSTLSPAPHNAKGQVIDLAYAVEVGRLELHPI